MVVLAGDDGILPLVVPQAVSTSFYWYNMNEANNIMKINTALLMCSS